jgi:hypothetical protein
VQGFPAGNDGSMMPAEKTFLKSIDKKVIFLITSKSLRQLNFHHLHFSAPRARDAADPAHP